jgi:hypothetical protein
MNLVERKISDWIDDPAVPAQEKLDHCFEVLRVAPLNDCMTLEAIGKSACWLAYRVIEGVLDGDKEREALAFQYVNWAKEHVQTSGRESSYHQARWHGSLAIALAYMAILRRNGRELGCVLCEEIMSEDSIKVLPSNAVNILRGCLLRAAFHHGRGSSGHGQKAVALRDCQELFKLTAASWKFDERLKFQGQELVQCATMVKLSLRLDDALNPATLTAWGVNEPFKSAFLAMSKP